jgi:hypothetical protein
MSSSFCLRYYVFYGSNKKLVDGNWQTYKSTNEKQRNYHRRHLLTVPLVIFYAPNSCVANKPFQKLKICVSKVQ